jgi:hypothetical protein
MDSLSVLWVPLALGLGVAILAGALMAGWAFLFARAAGESGMERPNWSTQFYAYSVCIVTLVVFLFSVSSVLTNAMDAAYPLRSRQSYGGASLTSFEAYRATHERGRIVPREPDEPATAPSDDDLRRQYEALREDRIVNARFEFLRALVVNGFLLILSGTLFVAHWRLGSRAARAAAAGTS